MGCGAAEVTGLSFVCFVVINPRMLSANRVDFESFYFLSHKFSNFTPPPLPKAPTSNFATMNSQSSAYPTEMISPPGLGFCKYSSKFLCASGASLRFKKNGKISINSVFFRNSVKHYLHDNPSPHHLWYLFFVRRNTIRFSDHRVVRQMIGGIKWYHNSISLISMMVWTASARCNLVYETYPLTPPFCLLLTDSCQFVLHLAPPYTSTRTRNPSVAKQLWQ